ncbi:MAG TPA: DUF47 family protein [Candidatus Nanoarchaeia archaeon]|nr:DUF47 family protein [Candidatus Nanoarchaeia archaeon]
MNLLRFLLPNEAKFFVMLNRQAEVLVEGAAVFAAAIADYNHLDQRERERRQAHIKGLEEKGDAMVRHITEQIDRNFITPFDREDIHQLSVILDDVLDMMDITFRRIVLYNITEADVTIKELNRLVQSAVQEVSLAVHDLRNLKDVRVHCGRINMLEHEADNVLAAGVRRLFTGAKNPIYLFKTKEIYEYLENITDVCKGVATLLESIVVKHG